MIDPKTFCVAPFNAAVVDKNGGLIPCCEFMPDQSNVPTGNIKDFQHWWHNDLQELRTQFVKGNKDSGCLHCDRKEKMFSSSQSWRVNQNKSATHPIEFYPNRAVNSIEQVEVRFGNYCNLKCIMCGEYASSSIASEYVMHQSKYNNIGVYMGTESAANWWDDKQSLTNVKTMLSTARNVSFAGGEPLILPSLLEILDSINSDCKLAFNTNLTKISDSLLKKLARFKTVNIGVSCEGTDAHNNYIRFGSKWDTIQTNIRQLQQYKNIRITIYHVLQHTSIFSLPGLVDWCKQHSMNLMYTVVYENSYPSPGVLGINSAHPTDITAFKTWLAHHKIPDVNDWVAQYSYDPLLNQKFHEYTNMLDSIRGTNFKETFNPTYD